MSFLRERKKHKKSEVLNYSTFKSSLKQWKKGRDSKRMKGLIGIVVFEKLMCDLSTQNSSCSFQHLKKKTHTVLTNQCLMIQGPGYDLFNFEWFDGGRGELGSGKEGRVYY